MFRIFNRLLVGANIANDFSHCTSSYFSFKLGKTDSTNFVEDATILREGGSHSKRIPLRGYRSRTLQDAFFENRLLKMLSAAWWFTKSHYYRKNLCQSIEIRGESIHHAPQPFCTVRKQTHGTARIALSWVLNTFMQMHTREGSCPKFK